MYQRSADFTDEKKRREQEEVGKETWIKKFLAREARSNIFGHVDSIKRRGRSLILSWTDTSSRPLVEVRYRNYMGLQFPPFVCVLSELYKSYYPRMSRPCYIEARANIHVSIVAVRADRGGSYVM